MTKKFTLEQVTSMGMQQNLVDSFGMSSYSIVWIMDYVMLVSKREKGNREIDENWNKRRESKEKCRGRT